VIVIAGRPQQAVHAGGDDRQPPYGALLCTARFDAFSSAAAVLPYEGRKNVAFTSTYFWKEDTKGLSGINVRVLHYPGF